MSLKRQATPSVRMDATNAIILHTDQVQITIRRSAIAGLTAAQIEAVIALAAEGHELPPLFVHVNRDGTYAMATGEKPDVWPEDFIE